MLITRSPDAGDEQRAEPHDKARDFEREVPTPGSEGRRWTRRPGHFTRSDAMIPRSDTQTTNAAPPDLLDVSKRVLSQLDYLQGLWGKEGITDGLCSALRAAIARAEARSE
jgi:hypothetical protein